MRYLLRLRGIHKWKACDGDFVEFECLEVRVGRVAIVGMDTRPASPLDEYVWIHCNKVILPTAHVHLFLSCKIICHEVTCTPFPFIVH